MGLDDVFKKECEEIGIDYGEFPFSFPLSYEIHWSSVIEAVMWILKKRQDKMLR